MKTITVSTAFVVVAQGTNFAIFKKSSTIANIASFPPMGESSSTK